MTALMVRDLVTQLLRTSWTGATHEPPADAAEQATSQR